VCLARELRRGGCAAKAALPDGSGPAIALFNLAATPEHEAHGAFVDAMRRAAAGHPVIVLVDEAAFRARAPGDAKRLEERRAAWRALLADRDVSPVFVDLAAPDLPAVEKQFDALLARAAEDPDGRHGRAVADLAHECGQDHARAHAARARRGRGARRGARHPGSGVVPLVDTPEGDALLLWDTPGFGDSARLAKRLAQQGNPIGWFLTQVWDRFRDRTFWLTQKAVVNVRDEADVVLYLVNAAEEPGDAGYLAPELAVLEWIGKPAIVLLNQTGPPRPHEEEAADAARWRQALGQRGFVHAVLALDAFARCWVQEIELLRIVGASLRDDKRAGYARLVAAWQARRHSQFEQSMAVLAVPIAAAAVDREAVPDAGFKGALRDLGKSIGIARDEAKTRRPRGRGLARRLNTRIIDSTDRLIAIHELTGRASEDVRATPRPPGHAGRAGIRGQGGDDGRGGFGRTVGPGGRSRRGRLHVRRGHARRRGAGRARRRRARARRQPGQGQVRCVGALGRCVPRRAGQERAAALSRGRALWPRSGRLAESEYPPHWPPEVERVAAAYRVELAHVWSMRSDAADETAIAAALAPVLTSMARELLDSLYPSS